MKLLTAIKRQPADNCIILTFNADLLFFEHMLFEPLYAAGCRNTFVLCDPAQYSVALDDVEQMRYAGQRYLFLPGRTSPRGAFHPKLVLLTTAGGGRLFVASGNLTKAGYTRNWEVVTLFEYSAKKPDSAAWQACHWAYKTLSQIVEAPDADKLARQRLEQLWGTTPWLRQEPPRLSSASVSPLDNLSQPLMQQLQDRYRAGDGSAVREAVIVSPYLDPEARAIDRLLGELGPERVRLYTQEDTHGLSPAALASVLAKHGAEFHLYRLELEKRRLHAKALLLRTERGAWLATGSANFSRPAWLEPAATGNTEIVILRFEEQSAYFDRWLDELLSNARPLELDWDAELPKTEAEQALPAPQLTLLSTILRGQHLELRLGERLPPTTPLSLELTGTEDLTILYEHWQQGTELDLHLPLGAQHLAQLEGPARVRLRCLMPKGTLHSNAVLVHNLLALARFSRPLERRERPQIPEGVVPESYEHCALLLEMIHDLLATNAEQLRCHRKRISDLSKKDRQEEQMAVEEEGKYDPESHFVDERVDAAVSTAASQLYDDFSDRLTYEELLRAALSAVYRPMPAITGAEETRNEGSEPIGTGTGGPLSGIKTPPLLPGDEDLRAKVLARIERGFKRLVGSFVEGTTDPEYLEQVPPQYHVELFVIISTYLRVVRRDGMLDTTRFVDLSLELLAAFWGQPRQSGAWQVLQQRLDDELVRLLEDRLRLGAQTWLHAYSVAELLYESRDRRVYDLASWMRHLSSSPDALALLPEDMYRRLWRVSFPSSLAFMPAAQVVTRLQEISGWYDDDSLLAEISAWPGTRAHREEVVAGHLSQVPQLTVTMPLDDSDLDLCLRSFILFLLWPKPKGTARASFVNTNPITGAEDVQRIVAFYRDDRRSLVFAAERETSRYRPEVYVEGMTAMDLKAVQTVEELGALGSNA